MWSWLIFQKVRLTHPGTVDPADFWKVRPTFPGTVEPADLLESWAYISWYR